MGSFYRDPHIDHAERPHELEHTYLVVPEPRLMHPFKLPDFYMPYKARMNPYLDGARVHSKVWSFEMGILSSDGDAVWDEKTFDKMDFALFTAQTHPDVSSEVLHTLTDWFIWGWFVDDYFPHAYGGSADEKAAREYLERLIAFMPVDLGAVPEPTNPAERGVADLWPRTASQMSKEWRRRCVANLRAMAEATLWEVYNRRRDPKRMLDPIEFVAMRRKICGMAWAADLVEFSLGMEIPPDLYDTRPIRVINDVFADAGGLRNDILSYHHDEADGTRNNGVMVVQAFLGCDLQRAVDVVNDIVSSRMFQMENTLATELPALFEHRALDPATRWSIARYVRGVQDWIAGEFKWCMRPGGRYLPPDGSSDGAQQPQSILTLCNALAGLGTASASLGLPNLAPGIRRAKHHTHVFFRPVGEVRVPELDMPYPTHVNPHEEEARASTLAFCRAMGMLDPFPGAPLGVWSERNLASANPSFSCARMFPHFDAARLSMAAAWMAWKAYADDDFLVRFGLTRDLLGAELQIERLLQMMRLDGAPGPTPVNPLERGLADLWPRTIASMPLEKRREFWDATEGMFRSWQWELSCLNENRIPDQVDYIEMRRKTFGSEFATCLGRADIAGIVPPEIVRSQPMRSLESAAHDYGALVNDLFSFRKEIEFDGELSNSVLVMEKLLDIDHEQALTLVASLANMRIKQFEHARTTELPALLDDLGVSAEVRDDVNRHVEGLQDWMAGVLETCKEIGRYREGVLRPATLAQRLDALRPASKAQIPRRFTERASPDVKAPEAPQASILPDNITALYGMTGLLGTSAARLSALLGEKSIPQ